MALQRLKNWARVLKRDIIALWIAARDRRTPALARIAAASVAGFALSPIDLIPDFIPVLGYLDDLIIVPLGIALAIRLIPPPLLADFRSQAMQVADRPASMVALTLIILLWLDLFLLSGFWALQRFG